MSVMPILSSLFISSYVLLHEEVLNSFQIVDWVVFYAVSVLTMAFAVTPTTFICLLSGFLIGFSSLIPIVVSYQAASAVGYFLSNNLSDRFIEMLQMKYPKGGVLLKNVSENQLSLTLLSRLSPALPFAIMNVVLSISGIRFRPFFLGGLIGMLPRTVFFIWVGIQASNLTEALDSKMNMILVIIISLAAIILMAYLLKRKSIRTGYWKDFLFAGRLHLFLLKISYAQKTKTK